MANIDKIKNDITALTDKHWDTGLLAEHRSIILVQELKAKGYKKENFENIQFPIDFNDRYDYGALLDDILYYFDYKQISLEKAHDIFYNAKIIPNTIGLIHFINSKIKKYNDNDYTKIFIDRWKSFHDIEKLNAFFETYAFDNNCFDKLIYDFYRQFYGLLKTGSVIRDSAGVMAIQKHLKEKYNEVTDEIKKKNGRMTKKNILQKIKKNINYGIFYDHEPETKMILDGHYRNEMPGNYDWTDYRKILLKLIEGNMPLRINIKTKYYSSLLPEERKNVDYHETP